ncbi:amidohydrolase family protein [Rhodococcus jostii]|uniref:Cytosine/adenosine deaminase n=1 Tax=Rhodococcus jostii TaxID=132919 RepID=A0A1H4IT10_RHOJO|nr:amidohydrolase family protein [Rhodococcus jostii]SEB37210.1 Cytosine/adenosine deaminase [Rhodococcus jostii]
MPRAHIDTLINNTMVVTMNADRHVLADASVAINRDRIVDIGKTAELDSRYDARETIDGSRFVVTPGMVNTHVHLTGEPLTKGYAPENIDLDTLIFDWLCPMYGMYTEDEERLSAQLLATEMLKSGTTCFLEAGSIKYVDAVVDGLVEIGIRGRVGKWIWDLPPEPLPLRQSTVEAIANLEKTLADHRNAAGGRIQAWAMVLGHTTCSDELWTAAADAAKRWETGINFHMSHGPGDAAGFAEQYGERPLEHLDRLGVLGPNCVVAHAVHVTDAEIDLLARSGTSVAHAPTAALRCSVGVTQIGRVPELVKAGVNVSIGIDGCNASNYADMMRATYLVAGLYKDARRDPSMFPSEMAFEMATLGGARSIHAEHEIGSIEVGKKADLVLHDRLRPEWTPLLNVAAQLVWSADGRGVHTVFVDGRKVVDNYSLTTIDEVALYRRAQTAGEAIVARSGLPDLSTWKVI